MGNQPFAGALVIGHEYKLWEADGAIRTMVRLSFTLYESDALVCRRPMDQQMIASLTHCVNICAFHARRFSCARSSLDAGCAMLQMSLTLRDTYFSVDGRDAFLEQLCSDIRAHGLWGDITVQP